MKTLYIMGTEGSGKTTVGLGMALALKARGLNVGYIKPIGSSSFPTQQEDEDAVLFQETLQLPYDLQAVSPLNIGTHYLSGLEKKEKFQQKIDSAMEEVEKHNFDLLIIGGATTPSLLSSQELDDTCLAKYFKSPTLVVSNVKNDYSFDLGLLLNRYLQLQGVQILGNIFNNVSRPLLDKVKGIHVPIMEKQGHKVIGVVPATQELTSPTAWEFLSVLGGELLAGEDYLNKRVDDIVIGSMTIEGALKYLRRTPNKAVIVGGDRNDLALTALETNTSVLILTGGLYPNVKVIAEAEEKKVPVILVHHDTYSTIEQVHNITRRHRVKPSDEEVISAAQKNIEAHCDLSFLEELGL